MHSCFDSLLTLPYKESSKDAIARWFTSHSPFVSSPHLKRVRVPIDRRRNPHDIYSGALVAFAAVVPLLDLTRVEKVHEDLTLSTIAHYTAEAHPSGKYPALTTISGSLVLSRDEVARFPSSPLLRKLTVFVEDGQTRFFVRTIELVIPSGITHLVVDRSRALMPLALNLSATQSLRSLECDEAIASLCTEVPASLHTLSLTPLASVAGRCSMRPFIAATGLRHLALRHVASGEDYVHSMLLPASIMTPLSQVTSARIFMVETRTELHFEATQMAAKWPNLRSLAIDFLDVLTGWIDIRALIPSGLRRLVVSAAVTYALPPRDRASPPFGLPASIDTLTLDRTALELLFPRDPIPYTDMLPHLCSLTIVGDSPTTYSGRTAVEGFLNQHCRGTAKWIGCSSSGYQAINV